MDRTPCRIPFAWPPALDARAAFDTDRRRVVVMGTWGNSGRGLEVWELDPATGAWNDRTPCPLPSAWPTVDPQLLGYDRGRHKTVFFDGGQTWEWDGQAGTWELRASGGLPLYGVSLAGSTVLEYDPQRRTMVLPGRSLFDWDGTAGAWTLRWTAPDTGSPAILRSVFDHGVAFGYDPDRSVVMTFGGDYPQYAQQLWETDGTRWIDRTPFKLPAVWPTGRAGAHLFYEPTTHKMILASGWASTPAPDDLWAFDATTGTFTPAPPDSRGWAPTGYAYAPTAGEGRVVMFESPQQASYDPYLGHALTWNVTAGPITDLRPAYIPMAWPIMNGWAGLPGVAYDVRRGRVVLFGGHGDPTTYGTSASLLEWNGQDGTWQDRTVLRNCQTPWPPSRRHHAMAADSRRGLILIFGGDQLVTNDSGTAIYQGPILSDYWEWDGQAGTFTQRSPATATADWPPGESNSIDPTGAMTYDEQRDRVVLVGPYGQGPWELDPVAGIWTPPPNLAGAIGNYPVLLHGQRDAAAFAVGAESGSPTMIESWDPVSRSWTIRVIFDAGAPRWGSASGAAIDPISGLVWAVSGKVSSWQPGDSAWTDRSSIAAPPNIGDPVPGGSVVFDERRGTLVLFVADWRPWNAIGVLELAVP